LFVGLFDCLLVCLIVCLFVGLFDCLFVCLIVCARVCVESTRLCKFCGKALRACKFSEASNLVESAGGKLKRYLTSDSINRSIR
jgi:hypothetical protein